jgi:hypothetical protein
MQIGSAIHALVQSVFIHGGFTTKDEVEVSFTNYEHWVRGTVDVRRFYLPDGRHVMVEIKSAGYLPKQPHRDHVLQFQPYLDLGDEEPQEIGVLFYVEKSYPHRTKEFIVKRDEEVLDQIYSKWKRVREAVEFDQIDHFKDCCPKNSKIHLECPARLICRIGRPVASELR